MDDFPLHVLSVASNWLMCPGGSVHDACAVALRRAKRQVMGDRIFDMIRVTMSLFPYCVPAVILFGCVHGA